MTIQVRRDVRPTSPAAPAPTPLPASCGPVHNLTAGEPPVSCRDLLPTGFPLAGAGRRGVEQLARLLRPGTIYWLQVAYLYGCIAVQNWRRIGKPLDVALLPTAAELVEWWMSEHDPDWNDEVQQ